MQPSGPSANIKKLTAHIPAIPLLIFISKAAPISALVLCKDNNKASEGGKGGLVAGIAVGAAVALGTAAAVALSRRKK